MLVHLRTLRTISSTISVNVYRNMHAFRLSCILKWVFRNTRNAIESGWSGFVVVCGGIGISISSRNNRRCVQQIEFVQTKTYRDTTCQSNRWIVFRIVYVEQWRFIRRMVLVEMYGDIWTICKVQMIIEHVYRVSFSIEIFIEFQKNHT